VHILREALDLHVGRGGRKCSLASQEDRLEILVRENLCAAARHDLLSRHEDVPSVRDLERARLGEPRASGDSNRDQEDA
jgi:hypothetical protein